ncbi:EpsG family protein [Sphingobacterium corticis]|uniref:EpsG family protein n=1 Tax=Sphingobacterium corticis TaxID=1812823 RepID=A0ABW5NGS1_9SPHI
MIPYIIFFLVSLAFVFIDIQNAPSVVKKTLLLFFGCFFILFAGVRWETGTDWDNYYAYFNIVPHLSIGNTGFEILYEYLVRSVHLFSDDFASLNFVTASLIIIPTYVSIYYSSPYPLFSVFLLLTYSLNSSGFGYRQDIAIALTTSSFIFAYRRQLIPFASLVILASLVHQSAFIFIFAYWLINFKWSAKSSKYLFLLVLIGSIVSSQIVGLAGLYSESAAGKVGGYSNLEFSESTGDGSNPYLIIIRGVLNRSFLLIISGICVFKYLNYPNKEIATKFFNIYMFGFILFILFSPLGTVFTRFTRYFDIFFIFLIPICLYSVNNKKRYNLLILIIFYCSLKLLTFLALDDETYVPYKTKKYFTYQYNILCPTNSSAFCTFRTISYRS